MAEITSYRPSCNAIQALETCLLNSSTWTEHYQPWELGDATRSFLTNNTTTNNVVNMEHLEHLVATSSMDFWKIAASKLTEQQHDKSGATFKEPTSVLDLQTSSLTSQRSFNSVSDGTSTAVKTVTDQLLSDEQDSAFLLKSTTTATMITAPKQAANSNNMLMDHDILSWMELMRGSEHAAIEVSNGAALVRDLQEQHIRPQQQQQQQHLSSDVEDYSCTNMDLDDFEVGTMQSITSTPHSSHVESAPFAVSPPPPEQQQQQQVLCQRGTAAAASSMPESTRNQIFSHNSKTLLSPGSSYNNNVVPSVDSQGTAASLPSMFDSITAIPASQLQNYTVVPTAELMRLLSSQNPAPPPCVAGRLGANFALNDQPDVDADPRRQWTSTRPGILPAAPRHNIRRASTAAPDQENGLHLVHLLLACAEAIDLCENTIAEPMLARLRSISDPDGDPMQRIALYFAEALSERLANEMAPPSPSGTSTRTVKSSDSEEAAAASTLERDIAYQAYYQILPFQKFTHFTANQALLEVVTDYPCVHIVDFNIRQGLQWPSFMQSLALLPQGPPRLRITAVQTDSATAHRTGRRLADFARSMQVPFEFHVVEESLETFHRGMVSHRADEALAVNCTDILHTVLRKEGKLHSLLCKIRSLRPLVVTVLEADANHNVPSFMARFVQALHYYCALFDSLEATLHRSSMERLRIENLCFGAEIRSIVALEGVDREVRHVRAEAWQTLFQQAGFREVPVSRYAADQAQLLLSLYKTSDNMPFHLSPESGGLSLRWQETPVTVVSSWTC